MSPHDERDLWFGWDGNLEDSIMSNIFISYSRHSEAIARTLANDIEKLGYTVWFDQELSGGQAWWSQILARVRDCHVFVFVLDPKALNSTACKREYGYADDLGKPILPVLVAEDMSTNLLPPALSQIQFVDYRKRDGDAALRLARALTLTTVPPPKPLPDPLPLPPEVPISYLGSLAEKIEITATLSNEEQSALVIGIKRSLRDPETTNDGYTLLQGLKKRPDLLASIAEEIDELLASTPKARASPPRAPEPVPSDPAALRGPEITIRPAGQSMESLPRWRSWLLAYKQASIKGAVYKALFYFFLAIMVLGGIGLAGHPAKSEDNTIVGFIAIAAIALAFRAAAARDYRKRLQKGSTPLPKGAGAN